MKKRDDGKEKPQSDITKDCRSYEYRLLAVENIRWKYSRRIKKAVIYHTSIRSTEGSLNLIPHPQHLLAVPGLPYLKRTKPPHSR